MEQVGWISGVSPLVGRAASEDECNTGVVCKAGLGAEGLTLAQAPSIPFLTTLSLGPRDTAQAARSGLYKAFQAKFSRLKPGGTEHTDPDGRLQAGQRSARIGWVTG